MFKGDGNWFEKGRRRWREPDDRPDKSQILLKDERNKRPRETSKRFVKKPDNDLEWG